MGTHSKVLIMLPVMETGMVLGTHLTGKITIGSTIQEVTAGTVGTCGSPVYFLLIVRGSVALS